MSGLPRPRITYLDGRRLRRLLLAGIARLAGERQHLDRINVFPVPDGDTGTNLTLTFTAIAEGLAATGTRHAGELLSAAADAALDGARGNSGAIFAQYLQGLADELGELPRLRPGDLGRALATASDWARGAMDNPQEGTVLTVMGELAAAAAKPTPANDFVPVFANLLERARRAVATTRETLGPQRRAGVEDAGALGLLTLLEGMAEALRPGLAPATALPDAGEAPLRDHVGPGDGGAPLHRYCTECLVTGERIDSQGLRAELATIGSSVVIVGRTGKVRIHAHVNDPEQVFAIGRRHGAVSAEKADDMARQERSLLADGRRVAIVSDSGADLPAEIWDEFGIHMVPLRVNFGDRSYLDKAGLSAAEFFRELASNPAHPTTSQPPPGDFRRAYELLSSHFEHVVSISITGRLSGTCQAATAAAGRLGLPTRVTVIDSRNASVGQGLIALWAAEQARAGLAAAEVVDAVRQAVLRTRSYGVVPDLRYAVRGGRIPRPWSWLAGKAPVSFVMSTRPDGGVGVRSVLSRHGDRVRSLLAPALRDAHPGSRHRLAIGHANCRTDADRLLAACEARFPGIETVLVTELGPAFGVHGGPGTLALGVQELPG